MRRSLPLLIMSCTTAAAAAQPPELSLKRVMLSTAGIGYFEYEAPLTGPATLGLDVKLGDVDDVLTSLVVFDSQGGVGAITLPGRDDTHAAFNDLPFGPDVLDSPEALLNGLQGMEISVQGPKPMAGRIIHAEKFSDTVAAQPGQPPLSAEHVRVTLLTQAGLRQFVLEDADSVQLEDPSLREKFGRALEAARREARNTVRHLTLRSDGTGPRTVSVGYVAGAPLWKASYRLVLPAHEGDRARLQGWAVLENDTQTDWKDVSLTLQYGNPVTFKQAIYGAYYVQRPEVPIEVLGRLLPGLDTRAVAEPSFSASAAPSPFMAPPDIAVPPPSPMMAPSSMGTTVTGRRFHPNVAGMAKPAESAEAAEQPEETVFSLEKPVSLAAGATANVPILDRNIPAERVDLLEADSTKPLAALRITNDGATSLPAGVLTLYDLAGDANFAGDARLGGLPAGESRLLSFAQDLRTTAERSTEENRALSGITAVDGVVHETYRMRTIFHVKLTAPEKETRRVLVEFPRLPNTTLGFAATPVQGVTETAAAWRVPVALKAGETKRLTVYRDQDETQDVSLLKGDDAFDSYALVSIIGEEALGSAARAALSHLEDLSNTETDRKAAVEKLDADITSSDEDEERTRKNLLSVAPNDAFHTELIQKLRTAESHLDALKTSRAEAQASADAAHKALVDAVKSLRL